MRNRVLAVIFLLGTLLPATPKPRPVPVMPNTSPPIEFTTPDWSDKKTWLKAALLLGAVVLVKMSFRKMKEDELDEEE